MIPAAYALPRMRHIITWVAALLRRLAVERGAEVDTKTVRVFIFAGLSNMVGSDSKTRGH